MYHADSLGLPRFDRIQQEVKRSWPTDTRQVMIDARDYYDPTNPSSTPFQFTVECDAMNGRYESVVSAELKAISFPKINDEDYVIMKIDEIPGKLDNVSKTSDQAFAIIYFDSADMDTGSTKAYKGADFYSKRHIMSPIKDIDRFHVTFYKYTSADTANLQGADQIVTLADTAGASRVSFIIELHCS